MVAFRDDQCLHRAIDAAGLTLFANSNRMPPADSVRLPFAWGGEHRANTRLMASDASGDGTTFAMIGRDMLPARRFADAGGTYRCD